MNYFQSLLCSTLFSLPLFAIQVEEPWGKDHEMAHRRPQIEMPKIGKGIPARMADAMIAIHQNYLSPTTAPRSHFRPSSSQYMRLAIRQHGFIKGYIMGCDRLMRENNDPWVYRTTVFDDALYKVDFPTD